MSKLGQLIKLLLWYKKVMHIVYMIIDHYGTKNLRTKRILKLKKTIILILLIVIVEVETSWVKFWVSLLRKILIRNVDISKTNFPIF